MEIDRLKGGYKYLKREKEMEALINRYDIYEERFASMLADSVDISGMLLEK